MPADAPDLDAAARGYGDELPDALDLLLLGIGEDGPTASLFIYAFATQGFASHILSGGFLTMLSLLYFLAVCRNHMLALSPVTSFFVKALVITTFIMVGHRSGFIGILLGLLVLMFFNKRSAIKETAALMVVLVVRGATALALTPALVTKMFERASTTFDTSQETYQLRYDQFCDYPDFLRGESGDR